MNQQEFEGHVQTVRDLVVCKIMNEFHPVTLPLKLTETHKKNRYNIVCAEGYNVYHCGLSKFDTQCIIDIINTEGKPE